MTPVAFIGMRAEVWTPCPARFDFPLVAHQWTQADDESFARCLWCSAVVWHTYVPWEPTGPAQRTKCTHGISPPVCPLCCVHGFDLQLAKLTPCPECDCPMRLMGGPTPHNWNAYDPPTCKACGTVKRI